MKKFDPKMMKKQKEGASSSTCKEDEGKEMKKSGQDAHICCGMMTKFGHAGKGINGYDDSKSCGRGFSRGGPLFH